MNNLPVLRTAALASAAVAVSIAAALAVGCGSSSSSGPGSSSSETIARQAGAADAQEVSLTIDEANARAQEHCRALSAVVGEDQIPPYIPPHVVERLRQLDPNAFRKRVRCVGERQGGTRCWSKFGGLGGLDGMAQKDDIAFQRWDGDVAQVLRCSEGGHDYLWLRIEGIPARPFPVANGRAEARCNELGRCMGERRRGTLCDGIADASDGHHAWQRMRPGGEAEVLQCRMGAGGWFWFRVEGFSNT